MKCPPSLLAGSYTARFVDRSTGGATTLSGGVVAGQFNRVIDTTSTLDLTLSVADGRCPTLPTVRADEIELTRDSGEVAWTGPVTRIVDDQDSRTITVSAEDRSYWWQGAELDRGIFLDAVDPVVLMAELIEAAERFQSSGLVLPSMPALHGLVTSAALDVGSSAWAAIDTLASSLIDYTVVADRLWWGGREIPVADGPTLYKSGHWQSGSMIVDQDATAVCSRVRVEGAGGIVGYWPTAGHTTTGYGKRTMFLSDPNLTTVAEAVEVARFAYEANSTPSNFMVSGGGTLGGKAPVCLSDLVPGRKFNVVADDGCLRSSEVLRLTNVVVDFASGLDRHGRWALSERSVAVDFARTGTQGSPQQVSA